VQYVRVVPLPQRAALVPVIAPAPTLTGDLNNVTLDGSGSYDLDNTTTVPLGFRWACDKGVPGAVGAVFSSPCIPVNSTNGGALVLPAGPRIVTPFLPAGVYRFTLSVTKVRV
jgi:hypothetical protein